MAKELYVKRIVDMEIEDFRMLPLGIAHAIKKLYSVKDCTEDEMPKIIIYQRTADSKKPFGTYNETPPINLLEYCQQLAELHASYRAESPDITHDSKEIVKATQIRRKRRPSRIYPKK